MYRGFESHVALNEKMILKRRHRKFFSCYFYYMCWFVIDQMKFRTLRGYSDIVKIK